MVEVHLPPLHPALVHFPVALFTVSLAADAIGRFRASVVANTLGYWCVILAVLGAAAAVAAGIWDMNRADLAEATHRFVHLHRDIGLALIAMLSLLAIWRWRIWRRSTPENRAGWPYLASAALVFALLAFQGWFGGHLVYGLGAGVSAAGQGVVTPEEGQMGLAPFSRFTEAAPNHRNH